MRGQLAKGTIHGSFGGMETVWWIVTLLLMLTGLIGTFLPMIPGSALILLGAVVFYLGMGPEGPLSIQVLLGLLVLTILTFVVDYVSGIIGAKLFGATRLGFWLGVVGGIVGLFFGIIGVLIGPIIGVFVGELIARSTPKQAAKATVGTVLGTGGGLVAKCLLSVAMIVWFLMATLT